MKRIIGRLVYRPAGYRSSQTGFNYRGITARRLSYSFCWIEGDLSQIEDWGTLKEAMFGPMTFFFEIAGPWQWKPGYFRSGVMHRFWWLCFGIAWVGTDLHGYRELVASGATEWRDK